MVAHFGAHGRVLALMAAHFGAHGRVVGAHGRVLGAHGRVLWRSWALNIFKRLKCFKTYIVEKRFP